MSHFALKPGTLIDGYEVRDLLGRGGMGAVYRVRRGEQDYALKTLSLETSGEGSEEAIRFRREVEILASLEHPGIVGVHSAGQKPGFCYYVMELVSGESLYSRLKRGGPLPPPEAVALALEVADAIEHAHERGIVHRDLKPANILLDETGRPLVTDFGLARKVGESEAERLTRTGEVLGTPAYLAPEQAFGLKEELDEKADVYGLGALLYAMLAGHAPFEGPTALAVMKKVSTEPPIPLDDAVPPELEAFVHRAMAKRREDRPPSARAFLEELQAVNRGPEISTSTKALVSVMLAFVMATGALMAWKRPWQRPSSDHVASIETRGTVDSLVEDAAKALFRFELRPAEERLREARARDPARASSALVALAGNEVESSDHVQSIIQLAQRTNAVLPGEDTRALEDIAVASSALALLQKNGIFDKDLVALKQQCGEREPLPRPLASVCAKLYARALKHPTSTKRLVELFPLPPSEELREVVAGACFEQAKVDLKRGPSEVPAEDLERIRTNIDLLRVAVRWDPRISPLPEEFKSMFFAMTAVIEQEIGKSWQTAFATSTGHLGYPTHPYVYYLAAHDARKRVEFKTVPPEDLGARDQWEAAARSHPEEWKAELDNDRKTLLANAKSCLEAMSSETHPAATTNLEKWLAGELMNQELVALVRGRLMTPESGTFAERLASFAGTKEAWEGAAELLQALDPDRERLATEQAQKAPPLAPF